MNNPDINRLEGIFNKYPAPSPRLVAPFVPGLAPGQIWTLTQAGADDPFREVVVCGKPVEEEDGLRTIDVAPLVHDATNAGPKDYILPEDLLCHHAAVLLSLNFSLPADKLGSYLGSIGEALLQDMLFRQDKTQTRMLAAGDYHAPEYFDQRDFRYCFHEKAAGHISGLQAAIYKWLDELEKVMDTSHIFAQFEDDIAMAAAGAGIPSQLKSFDLPIEFDEIRGKLVIAQSVVEGSVSLAILGPLAGICAKVLGSSGQEIASFDNGEARFKLTNEVGNYIVIADKLGQAIVTLKRR